MKFPIRFYALGVSAAFRVILTKISNRSGNAVQWNGGISFFFNNRLTKVKSQRNGLLQTFFHCSKREIGPLLATTVRFL